MRFDVLGAAHGGNRREHVNDRSRPVGGLGAQGALVDVHELGERELERAIEGPRSRVDQRQYNLFEGQLERRPRSVISSSGVFFCAAVLTAITSAAMASKSGSDSDFAQVESLVHDSATSSASSSA